MMEEDGEFLCPMVRAVIQESLEAESSGHYLFFDKFEKREAGFCREGASPPSRSTDEAKAKIWKLAEAEDEGAPRGVERVLLLEMRGGSGGPEEVVPVLRAERAHSFGQESRKSYVAESKS